MNDLLDITRIMHIYMISNTPMFFYEKLVGEDLLHPFASIDTRDLISEFNKVASSPIEDTEGLVFAYALYLAILQKRDENLEEFLASKAGSISFEWFGDLRSIFLARQKSVQRINLNADPLKTSPSQVSRKSNQNVNTENFVIYG